MKAWLKPFTAGNQVRAGSIVGNLAASTAPSGGWPVTSLATPNGIVTYTYFVGAPATGMRVPIRAPAAMTLTRVEVAGSTIGSSPAPQFDVHMVNSPASAASSTNCKLSAKITLATAYTYVTGALSTAAGVTWAAGRYLFVDIDNVGSAALTKAWITVTAKTNLVA